MFGQWADALGSEFFALEAPGWTHKDPQWFQHSNHSWEEVFESERIELLVEEMRELIAVLERKTGRRFDERRLEELMTRINQQEGYIAEAAQMIGNARPCPVAITDQMPNTMIPQWHRGSDWAVAHAKRFRDEVAERVRTGAAVSDRERVRLMWIGVGSGMILGPLRRCAIVAAFAAASATAFSAVAPGAAEAALPADAIVLLYASPYGPNHPFSRADRVWMDWVQTRTRGSLTIRPVWSGALLSSDESLTELRHGVADIGLITPIYSKGGVHLIRIHAGFYAGASTFQEQVAMYRCLETRFPEFARELQGLRVLAVQGGALPGILTRNRPVLRLEDLRGLRIRAPTELLDVLDALGAAPVDMPMGEVYSALAKGVIDGVVAPPDTLKALRFAEVAKYFFKLAVPRGAYPSRAMSEKRWQGLPMADRKILEASTSVWEAALARETQAAVAAGEAFSLSSGVEFHSASAADQRRFDAIYEASVSHSAQELERIGIDGISVFEDARRIAAEIAKTGSVQCL